MLLLGVALAKAPADRVPAPRPEPCLEVAGDPCEGEILGSVGLGYAEVRLALNQVINAALYCQRPEGMSEVHLTYELVVGCDGLVASIEASDDGGAPEAYVSCVASVIEKADFPAHDMPDGMPLTYPVDVSW